MCDHTESPFATEYAINLSAWALTVLPLNRHKSLLPVARELVTVRMSLQGARERWKQKKGGGGQRARASHVRRVCAQAESTGQTNHTFGTKETNS